MVSSSVDAIGRCKHKLSKRQKSNKGQDLISNLPDHIIGCVLSFLPTKDAVSTSVLSKRWIYLWTFITKLDFDDIGYCSSNEIRKACFVDFVDRVLLRLNSEHIRSFSLKMSEKYDSSYINKWISIVINLRVRKLRVYLQNDLAVSSDPLLKCQSLEELVLSRCAITLSTFVCLSSLAVLNLYCIIISCSSSNDSKTLTLNFPVLRKFVTFGCILSGVKSVILQVPLLEVVSISYHPFYRTSHAEIKFYASRIATFCYYGHMSDTILFEGHSVASADITLYNKNKKSPQEIGIFVCKLLSINPECLKLSVHGCISQVCFFYFSCFTMFVHFASIFSMHILTRVLPPIFAVRIV
ncbi:putative F-box domain, leucine-rich repeat domain, L domain-containing protein [Medicago truncatula]|uniref:Putative F-box domain, leucine-rich repeat domain, L domain-containing protein n=1 Tax=Medicago truncatula TaxID=3880 RepID=A0A396JAG6_MEDTR|nr:putative F-box domain, leucine-rich repeat domain, L domain-containing protein [Medicago truncatula]